MSWDDSDASPASALVDGASKDEAGEDSPRVENGTDVDRQASSAVSTPLPFAGSAARLVSPESPAPATGNGVDEARP